MKLWIVVGVLVFAGCKERNRAICCTDDANCEAAGLPNGTRCEPGFSCDGDTYTCEPSACAIDADCPANLGNCEDGICVGCDDLHPCTPAAPVCAADTTCQGCAMNADCTAFQGLDVCDHGACRACTADSECDSQVCDAGKCVVAADVVYMATTGTDSGTCSQELPCASMQYAISQAHAGKQHVVMAPGEYRSATEIMIYHALTPATSLVVHGNNSTISGGDTGGDTNMTVGRYIITSEDFVGTPPVVVPIEMRDLTLTRYATAKFNSVLFLAQASLYNVNVVGTGDIDSRDVLLTDSTLNDVKMSDVFLLAKGTSSADRLQLDEACLNVGSGVFTGTNLSIRSTLCDPLSASQNSDVFKISFSTFVHAGSDTTLHAVRCKAGSITSSILWDPIHSAESAINGTCSATGIVGPFHASSQDSSDPMFVDDQNHIGSSSPAIDKVACGTDAIDIDGDARPQGTACDYGADEYKP